MYRQEIPHVQSHHSNNLIPGIPRLAEAGTLVPDLCYVASHLSRGAGDPAWDTYSRASQSKTPALSVTTELFVATSLIGVVLFASIAEMQGLTTR